VVNPVGKGSYVGNDVMDLKDPRCRDRAPGDRLVTRILATEEQLALERTADLESWRLALWAHWAAKEAAYKVWSKVLPGSGPFVPRALVAELEISPSDSAGVAHITGAVRETGGAPSVRVSGVSDARYVHVVGWSGPTDGPLGGRVETGLDEVAEDSIDVTGLRDRFTVAEWDGVRSRPGAVVRLLARERVRAIIESRGSAGHSNGEATDVQIITSGAARGSTAPKIRIADREMPGWDVSLSHHGRYVAWALLVPE
jgi:phosphopantetheinyl transferase (holo-ACP synthase)